MSLAVGEAGVRLLADHSIIDTAPFFLPAFLVVGVLVAIVVRDRRRGGGEDGGEDEDGDGDGTPARSEEGEDERAA